MTHDDAAVFKALADPTRRRLLDLLLERGGRTVGELTAPFEAAGDGTGMTRFGVMKHLRVLVDAGLVVARPDGRTTRHYLNAVPIRELNRRWMDKYVEQRADAVIDLKRELEKTMTETVAATQLYQTFIRATPEAIWKALTDPEVSSKYFHSARIHADSEHMTSLGPDGSIWGDSPVEEWDPPRRLVYGWNSLYDPAMAVEPTSRVAFEIEPQPDAPGVCKLTVVHDRLDNSPVTAQSVSGEGWTFVLANMKSYLETGAALSA